MPFSHDLSWWISVIEIPLFSGLFWLFWKDRQDNESTLWSLQKNFNSRANSLLQGLNDFRLEVTRDYAQSNDLKELEARLTAHLLRIQAKLETTALKTEVLDARNKT
ncbi:MAG: hypothetical protein CMH25_03035 [Micavibrio sp.]|nr:hypothetical protein [Micavibrio sp.]|tara:strand:+ start:525 stop:845 length:321 start_codon:yes stop_codon:yes gene_type:complete